MKLCSGIDFEAVGYEDHVELGALLDGDQVELEDLDGADSVSYSVSKSGMRRVRSPPPFCFATWK